MASRLLLRAWLRSSLESRGQRILSAALLALALVPAFLFVMHGEHKPMAIVEVTTADGIPLSLVVADTPTQRSRGLSGLEALPRDGLILLWPTAGQHPIWMGDMRFPLDLIWLDETGRVVAIERNAPPCAIRSDCPLYGATVTSRAVVELGASQVDKLPIRLGDRLNLRRR